MVRVIKSSKAEGPNALMISGVLLNEISSPRTGKSYYEVEVMKLDETKLSDGRYIHSLIATRETKAKALNLYRKTVEAVNVLTSALQGFEGR